MSTATQPTFTASAGNETQFISQIASIPNEWVLSMARACFARVNQYLEELGGMTPEANTGVGESPPGVAGR